MDVFYSNATSSKKEFQISVEALNYFQISKKLIQAFYNHQIPW